MTATAATAAAAVSQELSPFGLALGVSRAGTKYPVRGIPHFDHDDCHGQGTPLEAKSLSRTCASWCSIFELCGNCLTLTGRC